MKPKIADSKLYFSFCIFLSFVIPGLGHLFWGYGLVGLIISSSVLLLSVAFSHFAALGAWTIGPISILSFGIYIGVAYSFFKMKRRPFKILPLVIAFAVYCMFGVVHDNWRRVQTFMLPSDVMSPLALEGDSIVIDTSKNIIKNLKAEDIVMVAIPGREGQYLRKVKSINEGNVVVVANDPQIPANTLSTENVLGRALYVIYSFDLSKKMLRWDRILKPSF